MPFVEPTNTSVLEFEGLHLYHAERSNCSARVRLLLEEKQLPWASHHINLQKKENVTEDYFGINPKGLVPALVYDGKVVIESHDIMDYIETTFPAPGFRDVADEDQPEIDFWLRDSGEAHVPGVKTIQYHKRLSKLIEKSEEEYNRYRELQTDPQLLAFHAKHAAPGSNFSDEDAAEATRLMSGYFEKMNAILAGAEYIVGSTYTLADMAWAPSVTTLKIGEFDFSPFPHVEAWYARVSARPQFDEAFLKWIREATWGN